MFRKFRQSSRGYRNSVLSKITGIEGNYVTGFVGKKREIQTQSTLKQRQVEGTCVLLSLSPLCHPVFPLGPTTSLSILHFPLYFYLPPREREIGWYAPLYLGIRWFAPLYIGLEHLPHFYFTLDDLPFSITVIIFEFLSLFSSCKKAQLPLWLIYNLIPYKSFLFTRPCPTEATN